MKKIQPTIENSTFSFNNLSETLQKSNKRFRRNVKGIWNRRLELFCGFIPALLVFIITYGKKFRE